MKKKSYYFFFLLLLSLFFSCQKNIPPASLTINFVGDIIPHNAILSINKNEFTYFLNHYIYIQPYLANVDLSVCNLETPIADTNLKRSLPVIFDAPIEFAQALKLTGFQLINIANNHALDCGSKGFKQTLHRLQTNHFDVIGYSTNNVINTFIYSKNGISIGFIGATDILNLGPDEENPKTNVTFYNKKKLSRTIKALKQKTDYIIVILHWGKEYITNQSFLKKKSHFLFQAGADCIIAHHPHILLPIETIQTNNKIFFAAYSLGNFLSDLGYKFPLDGKLKSEQTRQSVILQLTINKTNNRTKLTSIKITPIWIMNNYYQFIHKKSETRKIFPFPLDLNNTNILNYSFQIKERKEIAKMLHLNQFNTNLIKLKF